jgi:hypothetical protein
VNSTREFEERFSWRKDRWIHNLDELAAHAHQGGAAVFERLPGLRGDLVTDDPIEALRWSILILWLEATECCILGQFQSTILTAGAVLERILKLEDRLVNGRLPKGIWTLGRCIRDLSWEGTRIGATILVESEACIAPRNSRAHAHLEDDEPQLSISGGPNRGIQVLSDMRDTLEPYRGDALDVIEHVWKVLDNLYGPHPQSSGRLPNV